MKKTLIIIVSILLLANIAIWISGTTYIYKAIVYQQPNIDDLNIFDFREVKNNGAKEPWKISTNNNRIPLSDSLRNKLIETETVAFLVIKNDSICYEEYWDGYSDSSYSNSFSMAKSIVSILVGIAIDEGKIKSVYDPIGAYVPEFSQGELAKVTVKDLLMMASGLNFHESYSTPINQTTDAYYGKNLQKLMFSLKPEKQPGIEFNYKSGDTQILELVLKAATGKTISEYASEKLWSKIGAEHSAKWSVDKADGDEKAFCCFYSNARDFARIGKLYMNNGRWNNQQVVSTNWVKTSTQSNKLKDEHANVTDYYGYQWWVYQDPKLPAFYCRGILGQYIIVIPSKNLLIIRLGKKRGEKKINNHPTDVVNYIQEIGEKY